MTRLCLLDAHIAGEYERGCRAVSLAQDNVQGEAVGEEMEERWKKPRATELDAVRHDTLLRVITVVSPARTWCRARQLAPVYYTHCSYWVVYSGAGWWRLAEAIALNSGAKCLASTAAASQHVNGLGVSCQASNDVLF